MVTIIVTVTLFGIIVDFKHKNSFVKVNPVTKKIMNVLLYTTIVVGSFIILISVVTDASLIIQDKTEIDGKIIFGVPDVSNWVTLTAEIGVGAAIAFVIMIYSQSQGRGSEERISKHIDKAKDIIIEGTTGSPYQIRASIQPDTSSQDVSR